ncbi:uncharacterized protein PAC_05868 [Phialocephala subalpina]|uniref:Uncharacterized protein n=1 Tax=Phialocephala subalpina TaxID=576137 RepID=A0A1L7WT89_9HELO|nr:uncharacterized protein PAC_05868 [Phialocephala subalpina]
MTPTPEPATPPSMGCQISHQDDYTEPAPVPTPAPEHQLDQFQPQPQQQLQPAQYEPITCQALQNPQPQISRPQTPTVMLPVTTRDLSPSRISSVSPEQRGRSRTTRHRCNTGTCHSTTIFPLPLVRCPETGEPIMTEQELDRRWRQQTTSRELASRRRPLGHDPRYGGVPVRNRGMGVRGGDRGSEEEWEDGAPDVIEGGFDRRESRLRQSSEEGRKIEGWNERRGSAQASGGSRGWETESENEGLTVYAERRVEER